MWWLLLGAVSFGQPDPRTTNDGVLGKAEDFATRGPSRVCIGKTTVDLLAGEVAYLKYLGIHVGSIQVHGPHGRYEVAEGDAWRVRGRGFAITYFSKSDVRWFRTPKGIRYLIAAKRSDPEKGLTPRVWIDGRDMIGTAKDLAILERISVNAADPSGCNRRFIYGWNFVEDDDNSNP